MSDLPRAQEQVQTRSVGIGRESRRIPGCKFVAVGVFMSLLYIQVIEDLLAV